MDVQSEVGRGTVFYVYLPASGERIIREKESLARLSRGDERVLLVDDEEMVLDVGREILTAIGYEVFTARSGKEAVELYRDKCGEIDLVLLDMVMPDMCGGETYDCLKKIDPRVKGPALQRVQHRWAGRGYPEARLRRLHPETL